MDVDHESSWNCGLETSSSMISWIHSSWWYRLTTDSGWMSELDVDDDDWRVRSLDFAEGSGCSDGSY